MLFSDLRPMFILVMLLVVFGANPLGAQDRLEAASSHAKRQAEKRRIAGDESAAKRAERIAKAYQALRQTREERDANLKKVIELKESTTARRKQIAAMKKVVERLKSEKARRSDELTKPSKDATR